MTLAPTDPQMVERFRSWIGRRLGLDFDESKLQALEETLRKRASAVGLSPGAYLAKLELGAATDELGLVAEDVTVGETYFFRNADQFQALAAAIRADRGLLAGLSRPLRVLSAGCSTGEEAYTLAMVLMEALSDLASPGLEIRAVDINPRVLRGRRGVSFSPWALRETATRDRDLWFRPGTGGTHVLDDRIAKMVTFEQRNLAEDDPDLFRSAHYDAIFCRNVVMYFSPEQAERLIARFARSLRPGGTLFLGHAETLRGLSNDFHLMHSHEAFYYQRRADPPAPPVERLPEVSRLRPPPEPELGSSWADTIRRASERIELLATKVPEAPGTAEPRVPSSSLLNAAHSSFRAERYGEAMAALDGLPHESARSPEALLLRAAVLTHSGDLAEAEQTCRALLAMDELNAGAHYLLALCREGQGDPTGAVENDRTACYLDPGFAMSRLHLGLLARRSGELDLARQELSAALILLQREDPSRLLLYGGGFKRESLMAISQSELERCGEGLP